MLEIRRISILRGSSRRAYEGIVYKGTPPTSKGVSFYKIDIASEFSSGSERFASRKILVDEPEASILTKTLR